ncbi:MAG: sensor histidine kinase [Merdibacter sp.]|nr:sensor histidine kinase [Merdibacter sp.]
MIVRALSDSAYRLRLTYAVLCAVCFLQLFFFASLFFFTTQLVKDQFEAAAFLRQAEVIPLPAKQILLETIIFYPILLLVMQMRNKVNKTRGKELLFLFLEIAICLWLLRLTSFTSNEIFLLVTANMLTLTRDRKTKGIALIILVFLFFTTNYYVISDYLVTVSFDSYLYPYTAQAANLLRSVSALLSTLVLIIFLLYILFLIQDQILESTQMQQMNRELQDLNHQLEEMADVREKMGETKERNRLAREIHDTLGHTLTGLSTGLEAAKALLQADPGLALKQLDRLSTVAKEGLRDVRRSVNKLRPDALENHSLAEALKQMIDRFIESTGVEVVFVCHLASLQFQADEEETIYRIVQESMTNSVRHGNADKIYVSFGKDEDSLIIIIEDNGSGCADIQEGFGLHHMKERVALLKGNVRFYGKQGFEVLVELPLRKELE